MRFLYDKAKDVCNYDLTWYWNYSEADSGIQSNYMAMVNAAIIGAKHSSATYNDNYNDFIFESVKRYRKISAALNSLEKEDRIVLQATYQTIIFPPYASKFFYESIGAACCIVPDIDALESLCMKHLLNGLSNEEKAKLYQIKLDASEALRNAQNNYFIATKWRNNAENSQ